MLINLGKLLIVFYSGLTAIHAADEEFYILKRLDTNELYCMHYSPHDVAVGLAWVFPLDALNAPPRWFVRSISYSISEIDEKVWINSGHWLSTRQFAMDDLISLPPILDESWNHLHLVSTHPGQYKELLHSTLMPKELHVSLLAKSDAQILLSLGRNSYLVLTFDPSAAKESLILQYCIGAYQLGNLSRHCYLEEKSEHLQTSPGGGTLRGGKEWVHFTIKLGTKNRKSYHLVNSVTVSDAKSGDVLLKTSELFNVPTNYFIVPLVTTLKSGGLWRPHESLVLFHEGSSNKTLITFKTNSTQQNVSCIRFYYYMRQGFGVGYVRTLLSKQHILMPTDGKWKEMTLRFSSGGYQIQDLIFKLPKVNVKHDGHVFALRHTYSYCADNHDESVISYIDMTLEKEAASFSPACQTISTEPREKYVPLRKTVSPYVPIRYKASTLSFGENCNISCMSFSGKPTCENLIICDGYSCKCAPGYHYKHKSCALGPPDHAEAEISDGSDRGEQSAIKQNNKERDFGWWWLFFLLLLIASYSLFLVLKRRPDPISYSVLTFFHWATTKIQTELK